MTPQEYVSQLEQLIAAGQDQQALEWAAEVGPALLWQLDAAEFERVTAMMEGAQMPVSAAQASRLTPRT